MVYRTISADIKEWALSLLQEGWNIEETTEMLGVCSKSITRWQHNFEMSGRVNPPSELRGRPHLLSSDVIQSLAELLADVPFVYLDEIQERLALYHDSVISKSLSSTQQSTRSGVYT